MYLISKIFAKEWFKALLSSLVVLFLLITVGDIINGFLRNWPMKRIFLEYLFKLPDLTGKMLPICALLASLFSINKLKTHSELMAILAGGFSIKKIYIIIFSCSVLVSLIQFINLGYVVPMANMGKRAMFEKSNRTESKYLARSKIGKHGLIWYKSENYFTSFRAYDPARKTLKGVNIYFLSEDGKLDSIYKAESAIYIPKDDKWILQNTSIVQELASNGFPKFTLTRNLKVKLSESPKDFSQFESDITTLNFQDLGHFISRLDATEINSTEYKIMYYEKISLALICLVFSLFPVAGIFSPNRRSANFGKSIIFTLIFTIVFWLVHSSSIALGNSGKISELLATMGIPFIFIIYIIGIYIKKRSL